MKFQLRDPKIVKAPSPKEIEKSQENKNHSKFYALV
jgi:hypothetical protein